jgi:hypothetical protein
MKSATKLGRYKREIERAIQRECDIILQARGVFIS